MAMYAYVELKNTLSQCLFDKCFQKTLQKYKLNYTGKEKRRFIWDKNVSLCYLKKHASMPIKMSKPVMHQKESIFKIPKYLELHLKIQKRTLKQ